MKIFKFVSLFFIVFIFGYVVFDSAKAYAAEFEPYKPLCVGINGRFYANQTWKGGYIEVGCSGDDGGAVNKDPNRWCRGEVQRVKPGDPFRLTKCSCFGSDKGCMKVGKNLTLLPPDSSGNRYIRIDQTIQNTAAFKNNSCQAKLGGVVITGGGGNKVCGRNGERITANVKISCDVAPVTITNTPTPTQPNECPKPATVTGVKVTCPTCFNPNAIPTPTGVQSAN